MIDKMPNWKTNEDGSLALVEGNPVFIDSTGAEKTVGLDTIGNLNREAKTHREQKEEALNKLKMFEGLDPEKAKAALELASKIDQKSLIDAGKVDELKNQITQQFTGQLTEKDKALAEITNKYENTLINNVFANSEFIRNNIAVPRDMFEATFRANFKVEKGEIVTYDKAGNRLLSKSRAGEYATPEEAFAILVESHPAKDSILKADVGSGSGSGGAGGNSGVVRTVRRGDQSKYKPSDWASIMTKVAKGEMKLVD
jgi:hypothetical protein